jgi:hypothetical protein
MLVIIGSANPHNTADMPHVIGHSVKVNCVVITGYVITNSPRDSLYDGFHG